MIDGMRRRDLLLSGLAPVTAGEGVVSQDQTPPYLAQNRYFAKAGRAQEAYLLRLHACEVLESLGAPRGVVLRGRGGDEPDVVWQLDFTDRQKMRASREAVLASPKFQTVEQRMGLLTRRIVTAVYQDVTPRRTLASSSAASPDASTGRDEVSRVHARIRLAMTGPDIAVLGALLADDWTVIHANGRQQTKAQLLAALAAGRARFLKPDLQALDIRLYGSTSVVTSVLHNLIATGDQRSEGPVRVSSMYVRHEGGWQAVCEQATAIS